MILGIGMDIGLWMMLDDGPDDGADIRSLGIKYGAHLFDKAAFWIIIHGMWAPNAPEDVPIRYG